MTHQEAEALREIRNSLQNRGRTPSVRELMQALGYKSPRSASKLIDRLIEAGYLRKKEDGSVQLIKNLEEDTMRAETITIPLVGNVACGMPILAEENMEAMIPVSTKLAKPPHRYFLLRAKGDSMDEKGINDGDLVLVKQQDTAEDGDSVVALIDDEATVKEFFRTNDAVVLKPKSSNSQHHPIILTSDFQIQGKVITSIPGF